MTTGSVLATGAARTGRDRKSRWPARLDWMQSVSGLLLALFMWGHMFFVSSILLGKDAMWTVTRFFEGYFLFGRSYPWIVSLVVAGVLTLLVVHAMLAVRKFPIDYGQYRAFRDHVGTMKHADTTLWWWQVVTGFAMFFLVSIELHGGIGLYRLAVKWGWLSGRDANATRRRLKTLKWALTAFFLALGLATLAAYVKIGIEHADRAGEAYTPAWAQPAR